MSESGPGRKRTRDDTRRQLLDAARRWLAANGRLNPVDVRLSDVVRDEKLTTGAAYQIWASQDDFRRDVAIHLASEFEWATTDSIAGEAMALIEAGATHEERIRVIGRLYFEAFVANDEYYAVLQLLAVHDPEPELAAALRRGYDLVHDSFCGFLEAMLAVQHRRVRPPHTMDDLAVLAAALTEGLALRHRVQPERLRTDIGATPPSDGDAHRVEGDGDEGSWHIYASALHALALQLTEPIPPDS